MFCDKVQDIGAISLPLAYNGRKKFASWIGYLFAALAVITGLAYGFEQSKKVGTVVSLSPPEPISKDLDVKDVQEKWYKGGVT